jgi:hypothetical protein
VLSLSLQPADSGRSVFTSDPFSSAAAAARASACTRARPPLSNAEGVTNASGATAAALAGRSRWKREGDGADVGVA